MKFGIVLNSNQPETVWNAFRLALTALERGHHAKVFLLGSGVELERIRGPAFPIAKETALFQEKGGEILACGTCLHSRGKNQTNVCPTSSMEELVKIVEESDRLISLG